MAAHTPGPWVHEAHRTPGMVETVPARTNEVWGPGDRLVVAWVGFDSAAGDRAEKEANARLIAAAPDLLQVAKQCDAVLTTAAATLCDRDNPGKEAYVAFIDAVRAAIAKAEGR